MLLGGIKAYRLALIIAIIVAFIFSFIYLNVSCGILLSAIVYFIYLWLMNYGISKAMDDSDKGFAKLVLLINILLITLLIGIGFFLNDYFSLVSIVITLVIFKTFYMIGVVK